MKTLVNSRLSAVILPALALLTAACTGNRYQASLSLADSLLDTHRDDGVALLAAVADSMQTEASRDDRMYLRLLQLKAKDKTSRLDADTAEAEQLFRYYADSGDKRLFPTACYYAGRTWYEQKNMPQALDYYQRAVEAMADETDRYHLRLKTVCYSQMGYLFNYQRLYGEAERAFLKAIESARQTNDTSGLAYGYRDLSTVFASRDDYARAINYLSEAQQWAAHTDDLRNMMTIRSYLASNYSHIGRFDSAMAYLRPVLDNVSLLDSSAVYSNAAKIYYRKGDVDSALYYFHQLEHIGKVYAKESAYRHLLKISLDRREFDGTPLYYDNYIRYADSVKQITQTEAVARTNSLFNFQQKERENQKLREQNHFQTVVILAVVFIALILALSLYFIRQSFQRSQTIATLRRQNLERILAEIRNKNVLAGDDDSLRSDPVYLRFANMTSGIEAMKPTPDDWKQLKQLLDTHCDHFTDKLQALCKLSEQELQVCMLLKIDMEPTKIAQFIGRSKGAVSSVRRRLYGKVFGKNGTTKDWDAFISSL